MEGHEEKNWLEGPCNILMLHLRALPPSLPNKNKNTHTKVRKYLYNRQGRVFSDAAALNECE